MAKRRGRGTRRTNRRNTMRRRNTNRKVRRNTMKRRKFAGGASGEPAISVDNAGRMIVSNPTELFAQFEKTRCSLESFKTHLQAGKTGAMGPGALYTIWNVESAVGGIGGGPMDVEKYGLLGKVHKDQPAAPEGPANAPKANGAFYLNHPSNNNILVTLGCGREYFSESNQLADGGRDYEPVNGGYSHLIVHYYKIYQETLYHLLINPEEALANLTEFLDVLYETLIHHLKFGHPGLFGLSKKDPPRVDEYTKEEIKGIIQDRIYLHCPPTLKRVHFHVVIGGDKVCPTPLGMEHADRHFKLSDLMTVLANPTEYQDIYRKEKQDDFNIVNAALAGKAGRAMIEKMIAKPATERSAELLEESRSQARTGLVSRGQKGDVMQYDLGDPESYTRKAAQVSPFVGGGY